MNPLIGLEIHVQIKTNTKLFCSCRSEFGLESNSAICPICTGTPGSLPVLNHQAVHKALIAACAFHGDIPSSISFDRKHYFYPDLPKGYQITQYHHPVSRRGSLHVEGYSQPITFEKIHIEEDAGKLIHDSEHRSLLDLNRAGIPLLEIVTTPCMKSSQHACAFIKELRQTLQYLEVSDSEMDKGSMRVDVNVSVENEGTRGIPVELKNMASVKAIGLAIEFEMNRQHSILSAGGKVVRETRLWNNSKKVSAPMRSKEAENDYRYLPEPDLPPLVIDESWIERTKKEVSELPLQKKERYVSQYGLADEIARTLVRNKSVAAYFEQVCMFSQEPEMAAKWVTGEVLREWNGIHPPVSSEALSELIGLVRDGKVTLETARKELWQHLLDGVPPLVAFNEISMEVMHADDPYRSVDEIIAANPDAVESVRKGKEKAIYVLVGILLKKTRGKADPARAFALFSSRIPKEPSS